MSDAHTTVPEAHAAYLKAVHHYNRLTSDSLELAERYYREALRHDPDYAPAYAGLSNLSWVANVMGDVRSRPDFPVARALANEAIRLDPNYANGHGSLAWISALYEWNWDRAEQEFRRTIELDPSQIPGYQGLADLLVHLRRFDEALATAREAVERDPVSPVVYWELGYNQYVAGQAEAAVETFEKLTELAPDFDPIGDIQTALVLSGRTEDALRHARRMAAEHPSRSNDACLAWVLAVAGQDDEARTILERAVAGRDDEYVLASVVAWAYAALDDPDEAFRWIRKAMDDREYGAAALNAHPNFAPLRDDPRFAELVGELHLED